MFDAMDHPKTLLKILEGSLFPPGPSPSDELLVTWHEFVVADEEPQVDEDGYQLCKLVPSGRSVTIPNPALLPRPDLSAEENVRRTKEAAALARREVGSAKSGSGGRPCESKIDGALEIIVKAVRDGATPKEASEELKKFLKRWRDDIRDRLGERSKIYRSLPAFAIDLKTTKKAVRGRILRAILRRVQTLYAAAVKSGATVEEASKRVWNDLVWSDVLYAPFIDTEPKRKLILNQALKSASTTRRNQT